MSSAEKLDQAMTLTEYLVFWQDEVRVEQHTRTPDGLWLLRETTGLDAVLHLAQHRLSTGFAGSLRQGRLDSR